MSIHIYKIIFHSFWDPLNYWWACHSRVRHLLQGPNILRKAKDSRTVCKDEGAAQKPWGWWDDANKAGPSCCLFLAPLPCAQETAGHIEAPVLEFWHVWSSFWSTWLTLGNSFTWLSDMKNPLSVPFRENKNFHAMCLPTRLVIFYIKFIIDSFSKRLFFICVWWHIPLICTW